MAVIIKKIELKNWFGYKGDYADNSFEFSDGVNIIVASNDVGKSKLHNAFRWLITDKVILKDGRNKYDFFNIDLNTINDVFNQHEQLTLKHEEKKAIGVRLTFEESIRGEKIKRIITKELICKKNVDKLTVTAPITHVHKEERGQIKTAQENFFDLVKKIIRPNLIDFFLVQGEALEHLTPLKGESLRTTINNLVNLNVLEKKCDLALKFSKDLTQFRQAIEQKDNNNNAQAQANIVRKNSIENEIGKIENDELIEIQKFIDKDEEIKSQYANQAALTENRLKLKSKIDEYNKNIILKEGEIKTNYSLFVSNYINGDFWLSKITDVSDERNNLENIKNDLSDYSAIRRTELDDKLSVLEQKMLFALERDQPRPEILEQMLSDNKCYVCSNELNDSSKIYMREKLIPYFKKELNHDDLELNKYDEVSDIFKKLSGYLNKYNSFNFNFFENKVDNIVRLQGNIFDLEEDLQNFISENGLVEIDENEKINLSTYNQALQDISKNNEIKIELESKLARLKTELSSLSNITVNNNKSYKLRRAEELEVFGKAVEKTLIDVKRNAYELFAIDLEEITNVKWKAFSEGNVGLNNQSIKVEFELNKSNQPDFQIKVIDRFGNNSAQGGGASQALRQLAVIFGLIEKAGGNVDYPFIADAPTSNMTSTLSEHFFSFQLDNASTQNILITKELWDDEKDDLNVHGKNVLEKVKTLNNAKLFTIVNGLHNNKIINTINTNHG